MISIVVACASNYVIGDAGSIPWHCPEDLKRFQQVTMGHPCIMGRKTWESLPEKFRPLKGRSNIVISREKHEFPIYFDIKEPYWATSLEDSFRVAQALDPGLDIFIIGGGQIYAEALEKGYVDKVILSLMKFEAAGETLFPIEKIVNWPQSPWVNYKDFEVIEFFKPSL